MLRDRREATGVDRQPRLWLQQTKCLCQNTSKWLQENSCTTYTRDRSFEAILMLAKWPTTATLVATKYLCRRLQTGCKIILWTNYIDTWLWLCDKTMINILNCLDFPCACVIWHLGLVPRLELTPRWNIPRVTISPGRILGNIPECCTFKLSDTLCPKVWKNLRPDHSSGSLEVRICLHVIWVSTKRCKVFARLLHFRLITPTWFNWIITSYTL